MITLITLSQYLGYSKKLKRICYIEKHRKFPSRDVFKIKNLKILNEYDYINDNLTCSY